MIRFSKNSSDVEVQTWYCHAPKKIEFRSTKRSEISFLFVCLFGKHIEILRTQNVPIKFVQFGFLSLTDMR